MNEEWFTQTNVCKPNFTVHHYFTFNPRTVNKRSCHQLLCCKVLWKRLYLWLNNPIYNPMQEILEYKSFTLIQIASSPYEGSLVAHCWLAEPSPCNRATMANRWQLIHPAFNPVTRASHQPPTTGFSAPCTCRILQF